MRFLQRNGPINVMDGITRLCRRLSDTYLGKLHVTRTILDKAVSIELQEYVRLRQSFASIVREIGSPEVVNYYWYHTIDLGDGLITPGDYDYRRCLSAYAFPESMAGMSVLDVGSATGFFAFEFERRGADVISVELASLADWDIIRKDREATLRRMMENHHASDLHEAWRRILDGPFQFCRARLQSKTVRCYSRVYDLTPEKLGKEEFDLIFLGDVFVHLFSPLEALDVLASLCRGVLVVATDLATDSAAAPHLVYVGKSDGGRNNRTWWVPNFACLERMLLTVGFREVKLAGTISGILRRTGDRFSRSIIHAEK